VHQFYIPEFITPLNLYQIMVCHCKASQEGKLGCGDECLNRMLNIECVQGTCPCGDRCSNQQVYKLGFFMKYILIFGLFDKLHDCQTNV